MGNNNRLVSIIKWIFLLLPIVIAGLILFFNVLLKSSVMSPKTLQAKPQKITYWTAHLGRDPKIGDHYINEKDKSVLVWIPAVKGYGIGKNNGEMDARPHHKVDIAGFWLGKYEVTNEQYQRFLHTDSKIKVPPYIDMEGYNKPKQPVVAVRFYEALSYVEWAGLRLPTEVEWEYAASAGRNFAYGTRDGKINMNVANYRDISQRKLWKDFPVAVGSYPANRFGLHDMAGNVWEWTSSLYYPFPYSVLDGRENLKTRDFRVMRGGSWKFPEEYARSTRRHRFDMHLTYDFVGIRVAKSHP